MTDIITTYGLFWRSEDVYWGAGSNRGSLLGVPAHARKAEVIDFRDQAGLYVLYAGHDLIYVGQAGSGKATLFSRLKKHRKDQLTDRWDRFSWFGLRRVLKNGALGKLNARARSTAATTLNQIEAVLIATAEPALNRQGGRFGKRRRYLQVRDERLGPTEREMIQKLYDDLEADGS